MRHPNKTKPISEEEFVAKVEGMFHDFKLVPKIYFKGKGYYIPPLKMSVNKSELDSFYRIVHDGYEVTRKPTFESILEYIEIRKRELTKRMLKGEI